MADLLIWFVWGPHLPPGAMSSSAASQQFDIRVMAVMAAPVMAFVLVYAGYALVVWRHREGDEEDGPPIHGDTRIAATWIGVTSAIVLGLFVFGTVELVVPAGAGAGEGNTPIWRPGGATPLKGAGPRPAVAVDLPLPSVRRVQDDQPGGARRRERPVQCDLAGRDPQFLGLPARGEGGREPRA